MDADELRAAFTDFFTARGHTAVASASLVPHDPTLLFTVAGMVPFKPYFVGAETPPSPRLVSVQKCLRAGGKHNDIEAIGRTTRHLTFLEMLGNFSFGDYFKAEAIPWAWQLVTGVLGLDPDRLWVTVHDDDDEAEAIWTTSVGFPPERVQRLGEDNFWRMAETGPCGPCSEIFYDKGEAYGAPGGPAHGGEERFVELWNLVFTQFDQQADGTLTPLPKPNIDTGAGLERILCILQGVDSVFDTDVLAPVVAAAAAVTGCSYGADPDRDVSLRILADHARAAAFLVGDGVFPANEGRGYVLRRIIRRAARHARQLGLTTPVMAPLVTTVAEVMGGAYPELAKEADFVLGVVAREEERFARTLQTGSAILEEELASGGGAISGEVAFRLHDTYGFPIDLTREVAAEAGATVDVAGFDAAMAGQRARARAAGLGGEGEGESPDVGAYRDVLEELGTTEFRGYETCVETGHILRIIPVDGSPGRVEVFLDRTPFYPEGGGQVGDTGTIATATGRALVTDTTSALPGLIRHHAVVEGELRPGQQARAEVDAGRRDAIRRNHTGTHLLHWALRQVLGDHVRQQGSLVAPDRLRFDFSHPAPVSTEELEAVEDLVNGAVLADEAVRTEETSRQEAEAAGAIAFFGERYGERVRVVHAGSGSVELCGGTHVHALGMVGPLKVISESSIGAGTRRIEALTGTATLARVRGEEHLLAHLAQMVRAPSAEDVPERVERLQAQARAAAEELRAARARLVREEASDLAAAAPDGLVVARRDGLSRDQLRELAVAVRDQPGARAAVLAGSPDGQGVALVAAVAKGDDLDASRLLAGAARAVGGGGGREREVAVAGGRHVERIDEALGLVRAQLGLV